MSSTFFVSRLVRPFGFAAVIALAGGLAACSDAAMPTGYAYHNEMYKAPAGKEAAKPAHVVGEGATPATTQTSMTGAGDMLPPGFTHGDIDSLTILAEDLLAQLVRNFGRPMEPTMILPGTGADNRDAAMNLALRRAMQNQQIPVMANEGDGPFTLGYAIHDRAMQGDQYTLDAEIFLIVQGNEITRQRGSVNVSAAPQTMNGSDIGGPLTPQAAAGVGTPVTLDSGY